MCINVADKDLCFSVNILPFHGERRLHLGICTCWVLPAWREHGHPSSHPLLDLDRLAVMRVEWLLVVFQHIPHCWLYLAGMTAYFSHNRVSHDGLRCDRKAAWHHSCEDLSSNGATWVLTRLHQFREWWKPGGPDCSSTQAYHMFIMMYGMHPVQLWNNDSSSLANWQFFVTGCLNLWVTILRQMRTKQWRV